MKRILFVVLFAAVLLPLRSEDGMIMGSAEGKLVRLEQPKGEATHRITIMIDGQEYVIAYAGSRERKLAFWENRVVRAEGEQIWIPGLKLPCLRITRIVPSSEQMMRPPEGSR